jgi:hypothetical protein
LKYLDVIRQPADEIAATRGSEENIGGLITPY